MDIAHLRQEYARIGLSRKDLDPDPFKQFEHWFQQAQEADLLEPNAMSLATASAQGHPSVRTVLLKLFRSSRFCILHQLQQCQGAGNRRKPLCFSTLPWIPLQRQVRISGRVSKISTAESLKYFTTRPRGSQLGAWSSPQSSVISSRSLLEAKLDEIKRKFTQGKIPLPSFWGGYRVVSAVH